MSEIIVVYRTEIDTDYNCELRSSSLDKIPLDIAQYLFSSIMARISGDQWTKNLLAKRYGLYSKSEIKQEQGWEICNKDEICVKYYNSIIPVDQITPEKLLEANISDGYLKVSLADGALKDKIETAKRAKEEKKKAAAERKRQREIEKARQVLKDNGVK